MALLCLTTSCTFLIQPDPSLFAENTQKNCADNADNDGDGRIDGQDPECLFCGDGIVDTAISEQCDDQNQNPDDGCSALCQTEPGFVCEGAPSSCFTICGDGIEAGSESCDDGNNITGDGCDANCVKELCGDNLLALTEQCDDGNNLGQDGCEADCTLICGQETGAFRAARDANTESCYLSFANPLPWLDAEADCEQRGGHLVTIDSAQENATAFLTTNTEQEPWIGFTDLTQEANADPLLFVKVTGGNLSFNGFEDGEPNNQDEEDCVHFLFGPTWNDKFCDKSLEYICELELNPCGDGVLHPIDAFSEQCDDGNVNSGDGCNPDCQIEPGFDCVSVSPAIGQPSDCRSICGDGITVGDEVCDDGNTTDGDGCSSQCQPES